MKKIYTKPSLHAEKFAVEGIMTGDKPLALSGVNSAFVGNEVMGNISFTDANTLNAINFADFIN